MVAQVEEIGAELIYWIFLKGNFERYRGGWIAARPPGCLELVYRITTGICIISNHITLTCNIK